MTVIGGVIYEADEYIFNDRYFLCIIDIGKNTIIDAVIFLY